MWALKVTQSTMAAPRRGLGNTVPHSTAGQVRGDRNGRPFLAFGDDLEEKLGAAGVDFDVAELVQAFQNIVSAECR